MKVKTIDQCSVELKAWTTTNAGDSNYFPVSAARASFGNEDKTGDDPADDLKLMRTLARDKHVSCFEHNSVTILVECPLFVARQIMRHRSFSFNEVSRRYTSEDIQFWIPDELRRQSKRNKQCSTSETVSTIDTDEFFKSYKTCLSLYDRLISEKVAREQARAVLPQSLITRFYMTGNLRSWWSFFKARLKEDTQLETRVIAQRMYDLVHTVYPVPLSLMMEY